MRCCVRTSQAEPPAVLDIYGMATTKTCSCACLHSSCCKCAAGQEYPSIWVGSVWVLLPLRVRNPTTRHRELPVDLTQLPLGLEAQRPPLHRCPRREARRPAASLSDQSNLAKVRRSCPKGAGIDWCRALSPYRCSAPHNAEPRF